MQDTEYLIEIRDPNVDTPASNTSLDIIFVHGLNPRDKNEDFARSTWTHENGNFWPTAQLHAAVPQARLLLFSYNSRVASDVSTNGIKEHALTLLERLSGERPEQTKENPRPIIFVAHSLGGLVVKQALVHAKNNNRYQDISQSTYGLLFFAVPHRGGNGATLGQIAQNIVVTIRGESNNDLVKSLRENSLFQEQQAEYFRDRLEDYRFFSVVETRPTELFGFLGKKKRMIIVDRQSATLGLPGTREVPITLDLDHSGVCRFAADNETFKPVKRAILELVEGAVQNRPIKPQFDGTRVISPHYVERPALKRALQSHREKVDLGATELLLVHGLPGSGKTQLLGDYAKECSAQGVVVYWLDASTSNTLRTSLLSVAQKMQLPHIMLLPNLSLDEISSQVLQVLEGSPYQSLFLLDNYESFEEPDGYYLVPYLPSSPRCQVVVTSRNGSPISLLGAEIDAEVLKVDGMTSAESIQLLQKTLRYDGQTQNPDLDYYFEHISCELMSHLPLAIAQAASYIRNRLRRTTGLLEALELYVEEYKINEDIILKALDRSFVKEYGKSVITTFDMAFKSVPKSAQEVLLLCGYFHHQDIRAQWFEGLFKRRDRLRKSRIDIRDPKFDWLYTILRPNALGSWNSSALDASLEILNDYSLIYIQPQRTWNMHPLVHSWTLIFQQQRGTIELETKSLLAAGILAELYDADDDADDLQTFRQDVHNHVAMWLTRTERFTTLLLLEEPRVPVYTLGRLIVFFDSSKLSSTLRNRLFVPGLVCTAMKSGMQDLPPLDAHTLDKIERLFAFLNDNYPLPASTVSQAFEQFRSVWETFTTEKIETYHEDIIVNMVRSSNSLFASGDVEGRMKYLEQAARYVQQHRHEMRRYQYFHIQSTSFVVLARLHPDVSVRRDVLNQFQTLVEEISTFYGPSHELTLRVHGMVRMCNVEEYRQDEAKLLAAYETMKDDPILYRDVLQMVLQCLAHAKMLNGGMATEGFREFASKIRDLQIAEYGAYHPETFIQDNMIFGSLYQEHANDETILPGTGSTRWPEYQENLGELIKYLLLSLFWRPEANFGSIWRAMLSHAENSAIAAKVVGNCVATFLETTQSLKAHGITPCLRECAELFSAKFEIKEVRKKELDYAALRRLQNLWKLLDALAKAFHRQKPVPSIEEKILQWLHAEPTPVFEMGLFLFQNYLLILLFREKRFSQSPLSTDTLLRVESLASARLNEEHNLRIELNQLLTLCYRGGKDRQNTERCEDLIITAGSKNPPKQPWVCQKKQRDGSRAVLENFWYMSTAQQGATMLDVFSGNQAWSILEQLRQIYSLVGSSSDKVRIYDKMSRSLLQATNHFTSSGLECLFNYGIYSDRVEIFEPFMGLLGEMTSLPPGSLPSEATFFLKDIMSHYLPSMYYCKRYRAAVMLAEAVQRWLDNDIASAEAHTEQPFSLYTHWTLLSILRKCYADLGYTYTAHELIPRQQALEQKMSNAKTKGVMSEPEYDEFLSSLSADHENRERLERKYSSTH